MTTELYPAESHSIIPVSYEFARGTVPGKRLNYVVEYDGSFRELPQKPGIYTGFQHFISAEYSQHGLFQLDFQMSVRHRPPVGDEFPRDQYAGTKDEFLAKIYNSITGPVSSISKTMYQDSGTLAPANIGHLEGLFGEISDWMPEVAYRNLAIFRRERDSNINPALALENYGQDIQIPTSSEDYLLDVSFKVAETLVRDPNALETILMLSDEGPLSLSDVAREIGKEYASTNETIDKLSNVGLVIFSESMLDLTEYGKSVVVKLDNYLVEDGMPDV